MTGGALSVAAHTLRQCLRMKVVGASVVVTAVVLGVMPFTMTGDGTLGGRSRSFLSYGTDLLGVFLGLLTVFLSVWVVTEDVRTRQVTSVVVKPLSRWQYVFGRWLGICALNVVLLLIGAAAIFSLAQYLRTGAIAKAVNPQDRQAVETQVFTARREEAPTPVDVDASVQKRLEDMEAAGDLAEAVEAFAVQTGGDLGAALDTLMAEIRRDTESRLYAIPPGGSGQWTFSGIDVRGDQARGPARIVSIDPEARHIWLTADDRLLGRMLYSAPVAIDDVEARVADLVEQRVQLTLTTENMQRPRIARLREGDDVTVVVDSVIQFRYAATAAQPISDRRITGLWVIRSPGGKGAMQVDRRRDLSRTPTTMTVSARVVSTDGRTTVQFTNLPNPKTGEAVSVTIRPEDVAILFRKGSFELNFFKGVLLMLF